MTNFRVEYYDESAKQMTVKFVEAEDSNEVKSKLKHKAMSICKNDDYKKFLEKYSDIMRR